MSNKEIKFKIDQLRKDKIIYQVESAALSLVVLVLYFTGPIGLPDLFFYDSGEPNGQLFLLMILVVVGYWAYTVVGNIQRYREIKELESKLNKDS